MINFQSQLKDPEQKKMLGRTFFTDEMEIAFDDKLRYYGAAKMSHEINTHWHLQNTLTNLSL